MAQGKTYYQAMRRTTRRMFRIELQSSTVILVCSLAGLAAIVLFVFGMVTGLGMRSTEVAPPLAVIEPDTSNNDQLAFQEVLETNEVAIEPLGDQEATVSLKTKQLVSDAERELLFEEDTVTTTTTQPSTVATAAVDVAPLDVKVAPDAELFSVQVFSSRNEAKARELSEKLKGQGFPAYINQYQSSNDTWYRVRVGKTNRNEAENLSRRIRTETELDVVRIVQL